MSIIGLKTNNNYKKDHPHHQDGDKPDDHTSSINYTYLYVLFPYIALLHIILLIFMIKSLLKLRILFPLSKPSPFILNPTLNQNLYPYTPLYPFTKSTKKDKDKQKLE
jgi:hypothetical protein